MDDNLRATCNKIAEDLIKGYNKQLKDHKEVEEDRDFWKAEFEDLIKEFRSMKIEYKTVAEATECACTITSNVLNYFIDLRAYIAFDEEADFYELSLSESATFWKAEFEDLIRDYQRLSVKYRKSLNDSTIRLRLPIPKKP